MGELHGNVDVDVASDFVCRMYGQNKTRDVNEARYNKLIQMIGTINEDNPLTNVRKIDCASLPSSRGCLEMKLLRAHYAVMLWTPATSTSPAEGLSPTDYGWRMDDGILMPCWFTGPEIRVLLFTTKKQYQTYEDYESESDDEAWSKASASDVDEEAN